MGLFSKRSTEPLLYEAVARSVHVPASRDDVLSHLASYSELWSPKRAEPHDVQVGEVAGWSAIRLPETVHPWQLHNLAFWMLDCPGLRDGSDVIAESAASRDHPGYRLVRDADVNDALCGWDDQGQGWTVQVPANDIVRGENVPAPRAVAVPSGYQEWRSVSVLLEDPGPGMNEHNESTFKSRRSLDERYPFVY